MFGPPMTSGEGWMRTPPSVGDASRSLAGRTGRPRVVDAAPDV